MRAFRRAFSSRRARLDTSCFYIDGRWARPAVGHRSLPVINPATEDAFATISLGTIADVDAAVSAARRAFKGWSVSDKEERLGPLKRLAEVYTAGQAEMAATISEEMGAPIKLATDQQAAAGLSHLRSTIRILEGFEFEQPLRPQRPSDWIVHEPIGVCGLITPWNWPMNQVALKVFPALAAGCTVVLKPSEVAPLSSLLLASMIDDAGFPAGVFNLVNGDGGGVGEALTQHADVDMISFTGSTRAGVACVKAGADTVKRVTLELGGKGPNIIFPDVKDGLRSAVRRGVAQCFRNSGQSCNAPTRMLLPREVYEEAAALAAESAAEYSVGAPGDKGDHLGPLSSQAQFEKVQDLIAKGISEGAQLRAGGLGRPEGFAKGYFVRPTVFSGVENSMSIAREEIFGPVLSLIPFDDEDDACRIANDTAYGLTSYVQTGDAARARRVARRLRAGMVEINGERRGPGAPFGGVRQSGNGREGGVWGLMEYLEVKSISGWPV